MAIRFERIKDIGHPLYDKAMEVYKESFPSHEQRKSDAQVQIMSHPDYHFYLIVDDEVFIGLMLCWESEQFIYIEHFCIRPDMRNNNYGRKSLDLICREGKKVILEIDPPVDEISVRRRGFYERAGFVANDHAHIHPPYHKDISGHELVIMSLPEKISVREYDDFYNYLSNIVMAETKAHPFKYKD